MCFAQQAAPAPPPGHGGQHMASAVGMPLLDGSLPPGTLTVRVVRGGFVENLAGRDVTVDVLGGKTERARTGPDGRVQIAHLPVGIGLRASAVVDGKRLESEVFEMPPDTGVRLLLMADVPRGENVGPDANLPAPFLTAHGPVTPLTGSQPREAEPATSTEGTLMGAVLAVAAVVFGIAVLRPRPRFRSASTDHQSSTSAPE
jgi:hypothetical protein